MKASNDAGVALIYAKKLLHRVSEPGMQECLMRFISCTLADDGAFVMTEWDNKHDNLDVYFDLAQVWPQILAYDGDSILDLNDPSYLEGKGHSNWPEYSGHTQFLSLDYYLQLAKDGSLQYDSDLQTMMSEVVSTPVAMADKAMNRQFTSSFKKSPGNHPNC